MENGNILYENAAKNIRLNILRLAHGVGKKGAHLASSLSIADIMAVLYLKIMRKEDSFILSKGHGALCWYCALHEAGLVTGEQLSLFDQNGGPFPGQPCRNLEYGIECSSGSLGMGMSYAAGLAWEAKRTESNRMIYILLGDGELNEGSSWESIMFAAHHGLNNMVAIVDCNGFQSDGHTDDILKMDIQGMWAAFGWDTIICDGHNLQSLINAFAKVKTGKPLAVVANTTKGKGISFMENAREWHHNHITDELHSQAIVELGGERIGV